MARLANTRCTGRYLRIPCPANGGTNANLALWVSDDGIGAKCHSAGCSYAEISAAVQSHYGISIGRARQHPSRDTAPSPQKPSPTPRKADLHSYALRLWHHSSPIPTFPNHPSRRWLAARNLWQPELPLPSAIRWVRATHLHRDYSGAGAIIALAAPPAAWLNTWPNLPELSSVQLVFVAANGNPATDRGLSKRTYAAAQDAVIIFGDPLLEKTTAAVNVAEGLADALALAAREGGTTITTLGTSGMLTDGEVARYLASSPRGVEIYADRDDGKRGKAPAGLKAATTLRRHIAARGGGAVVCHATAPWKDPAEAAAHDPFGKGVKTSEDGEEGTGNDTA